MKKVVFFKKNKPQNLSFLFPKEIIKDKKIIYDIKTLDKSGPKDLSFLDSIKYKDYAVNTKAGCCITNKKLVKFLPDSCFKIIKDNVLFELAKVLKVFYPSADIDRNDSSLKKPKKNKISQSKIW